MKKLSKDEIYNLFLNCKSKIDLVSKFGFPTNQNGITIDNNLLLYLTEIGFTDRNSISQINFNKKLKECREKEYLKNPNICPNCGNIIPFEKRNNKFCSQSCSTSYTNKQRPPMSDEQKQKISNTIHRKLKDGTIKSVNQFTKDFTKFYNTNNEDTLYYVLCNKNVNFDRNIYCDVQTCIDYGFILNEENYIPNKTLINSFLYKVKTCPNCGKVFYGRITKWGNVSINTKCCCDKCHNEHVSKISQELRQKEMQNGTFKGWKPRNVRSYAEKFWIQVLNNNNITYISEYPIYREGTQNYYLDFYIEKNGKKIDLEIDGKQHKYPERLKQDKIRDEYLKNLGYIVYRIEWNRMTGKTEESDLTKQKIENFLEFYNSL